jgi:nicotinate-nucleotide pyrophosphorylase
LKISQFTALIKRANILLVEADSMDELNKMLSRQAEEIAADKSEKNKLNKSISAEEKPMIVTRDDIVVVHDASDSNDEEI